MEVWQIRERGTDEVLREINQDHRLKVCVSEYERPDNLIQIIEFNNFDHYICRKGEILVSEDEWKHKDDRYRIALQDVTLGLEKIKRLSVENAALKAELAELKAQKESKQAMKEHFARMSNEDVAQRVLSTPSREPEKVTRGDEIVKLVSDMALAQAYAVMTNAYEDTILLQHAANLEMPDLRKRLATLIDQGV